MATAEWVTATTTIAAAATVAIRNAAAAFKSFSKCARPLRRMSNGCRSSSRANRERILTAAAASGDEHEEEEDEEDQHNVNFNW